jgi:hypothetical protein
MSDRPRSDRPTWDEIRRFLRVDGWRASGGHNPHQRFTKLLPDGRQLVTFVPNNHKRVANGGFFTNVLSQQLEVTPEQFWEAVTRGIPPQREVHAPPPGPRLPHRVIRDLLYGAGFSLEQIRNMSVEQVWEAWERWRNEAGEG